MKKVLATVLVIASVISIYSCERKNEEVAGKGGNATLKVTPQHHAENIDSCTVYLKYNAQDMPGSYDEEVKCIVENGKPVATFSGLKKGDYYVYGKGWDPDFEQVVVGGTPYKITEETTYNINVPVTEEGH